MNTDKGQRTAALLFADRAREIVEFCLRHGGRVFEAWSVTTLFAYVFFHVVARTVFVVRKDGHITAVAFAWSNSETEIRKRAAAGAPQFDWRRTEDAADSLLVAEVIGRRELLGRIARQFTQRWPDWQRRKIFTYRKGQLVELKPDVIARLIAE